MGYESLGEDAFSRLVTPIREAYENFSQDERLRLFEHDELYAAVALTVAAAKRAGNRRLARSLRLVLTKHVLEDSAGGMWDLEELAAFRGVSTETVLNLTAEQPFLSVDEDGRQRYPKIQFDDNGVAIVGLDRVLRRLESLGIGGWMALDVLCAPSPQFYLSIFDLLKLGRIDDALKCAAAFEHQGAV